MNKKLNSKTLHRIGNAIIKGWGVRWPRHCEQKTSRHSCWISFPDSDKWIAFKVDAEDQNINSWLNKLMDEAGIPAL